MSSPDCDVKGSRAEEDSYTGDGLHLRIAKGTEYVDWEENYITFGPDNATPHVETNGHDYSLFMKDGVMYTMIKFAR